MASRVERMESIGVLTGGVAHDLNNVLAPIMMAAGMLLQEELEDHLREAAEIIQESAQRGADMIRQILTFVRGATEQRQLLRLDDALVGLQRLVRDALAPAVADGRVFACGASDALYSKNPSKKLGSGLQK